MKIKSLHQQQLEKSFIANLNYKDWIVGNKISNYPVNNLNYQQPLQGA